MDESQTSSVSEKTGSLLAINHTYWILFSYLIKVCLKDGTGPGIKELPLSCNYNSLLFSVGDENKH